MSSSQLVTSADDFSNNPDKCPYPLGPSSTPIFVLSMPNEIHHVLSVSAVKQKMLLRTIQKSGPSQCQLTVPAEPSLPTGNCLIFSIRTGVSPPHFLDLSCSPTSCNITPILLDRRDQDSTMSASSFWFFSAKKYLNKIFPFLLPSHFRGRREPFPFYVCFLLGSWSLWIPTPCKHKWSFLCSISFVS